MCILAIRTLCSNEIFYRNLIRRNTKQEWLFLKQVFLTQSTISLFFPFLPSASAIIGPPHRYEK